MCTVTYIPKGQDHFILTSNRDENYSRAAEHPEILILENQHRLFPKDPKSGGSWIAVSAKNRVACLLNGAFEKHRHRPPYKRSRGLVLLDFFGYTKIDDFVKNYDFHDIEPFTMIMYEGLYLVEFRWDGHEKHLTPLKLDQAYIWSSTTLYDLKTREMRSSWFHQWLKVNKQPGMEDLMHFHRYGGEPDQSNGFVMNRGNQVQTLSITGIEKYHQSAVMHHLDLLKDQEVRKRIDLENETVESN
ncbi:MAG: NRDE family protein [Cyclobacteriaceae bacterium]|nr:NRDE family protein [Cyclobacteriaceae bacterium]